MENQNLEQVQTELAELRALVMQQQKQIHALERERSPGSESFKHASVAPAPVNFVSVSHKEKQKNDFEAKVGIYYLSRIGIVGLFLGIAFFLKYSFDNNWVGPLGRVLIGYVSGALLVGLGEYFRKKYATWAMVFTGGGLGVFYLSTFAAESYYNLISHEASFMLMSFITAGIGWLSVKRGSFVIALYGLVGGFLTPVLSSMPLRDFPYGTLYYLLLLNVGVLGVSFFKKWRYLDSLGFIFTIFYFGYLVSDLSRFEATGISVLYFILFSLSPLVHIFGTKTHTHVSESEQLEVHSPRVLLIISNAVFLYSTLLWVWRGERTEYLGVIALVLALLYWVQMLFVSRLSSLKALYQPAFLGIVLSFLLIGIFRLFELYEGWVTLLWAVFGTGVLVGGLHFKNGWARFQGLCILVITLWRYFGVDTQGTRMDDIAILNTIFIVGSILTACLFFVSREYTKSTSLTSSEKSMSFYFAIGGNFLLLTTVGRELFDFIDSRQLAQVVLSIIMALHAGILIVLGFIKENKEVRWLGLGLFGVVVLKVFFIDMSGLDTLYRVAAFIVVGILLILASYLYQRMEKKQ